MGYWLCLVSWWWQKHKDWSEVRSGLLWVVEGRMTKVLGASRWNEALWFDVGLLPLRNRSMGIAYGLHIHCIYRNATELLLTQSRRERMPHGASHRVSAESRGLLATRSWRAHPDQPKTVPLISCFLDFVADVRSNRDGHQKAKQLYHELCIGWILAPVN